MIWRGGVLWYRVPCGPVTLTSYIMTEAVKNCIIDNALRPSSLLMACLNRSERV